MNKQECGNCRFWEQIWKPGELQNNKIGLASFAKAIEKTIPEAIALLDELDECGHYGSCHRYPPILFLWDDSLEHRHPHSQSDNWCGEWQAKPAEEKQS